MIIINLLNQLVVKENIGGTEVQTTETKLAES
jgi:hypothetical protein